MRERRELGVWRRPLTGEWNGDDDGECEGNNDPGSQAHHFFPRYCSSVTGSFQSSVPL